MVIRDEQRRYQLRMLARDWSVVEDEASRRAIHPNAAVAWTGPDGCRGALIVSKRAIANYKELEPLARARLQELPVKDVQTLWFEATRYNDRPGYRFSARGKDRTKPASDLRYRYSIGERDGWVFEVLAASDRHFTTARWCHDRVTAAASF